MDTTPLPTRAEFQTRFPIDEQATVEAFWGKTLEEVQTFFQGNFLWYANQLSVAAPKPFCFYVVAATNYLRGVESTGDPDSINGFYSMIEHRLNHPGLLIPIDAVPNISATIEAILRDFDRYDADVEIYGDLKERYHALLVRLLDLTKPCS